MVMECPLVVATLEPASMPAFVALVFREILAPQQIHYWWPAPGSAALAQRPEDCPVRNFQAPATGTAMAFE